MNMTRTKREATIMVRQFGLDAVIKNGNRYKVANVEICENCGRPAMLVNWFDVNKTGADHFISQGFKFYEGVTCEATTNDDRDDLCTGCVNQLKEQEAGKVIKISELSPKATANAVMSYQSATNLKNREKIIEIPKKPRTSERNLTHQYRDWETDRKSTLLNSSH